jgi:hypothetical protein
MNFRVLPDILIILAAGVFLVGLCSALVFGSWNFAVGFAAGGALVVLNTWASARKLKNVGFQDRGRALVSLVGGFYARLAALAVCLYILVAILKVNPVGLVTGLSVVPAGLFVMSALIYLANRRPKEV